MKVHCIADVSDEPTAFFFPQNKSLKQRQHFFPPKTLPVSSFKAVEPGSKVNTYIKSLYTSKSKDKLNDRLND